MDQIVKMRFGAHLYGTADEGSDIDYKGVFLPSRSEVLLGRIPKSRQHTTGNNLSKNRANDVDEQIYSLHHFIELACQGQIVAMDMLHAPDDFLEINTDSWQAIVKQRHRFYTKSLRVFVGYARRQTAKYGIRGSRLDAAAQVLAVLRTQPVNDRLNSVWEALPRVEHADDAGPDPNGIPRYMVCGKTFLASTRIGQVVPVLEKFYDSYGARAKEAAENKNIDWKAVSHAMRAAIQTREILTLGCIRYPLADASYLKAIKAGHLDYTTEVAPALSNLVDEVSHLLEQSDLPEQVDRTFWDAFICETLEKYRFGKI